MRKLFERLSMSRGRRTASDRIDDQVLAGTQLLRRIENLRGKDQGRIPREHWVSSQEIASWRGTASQLIEELFGRESKERQEWEQRWNEEPPTSPYDQFPEDIHLNRISFVLAYLRGLKASPALSRNAIERARDRLDRHPVLGVSLALLGALSVVFGVVRGVVWLISMLQP